MNGDREALVSMLAGAGVWLDRCPEIADTILESDWLARVKAETLLIGVSALENQPETCVSPGCHAADQVKLRDLAFEMVPPR